MQQINLDEGDYERDDRDPPGFRAAMLRPGPRLGASQTGMSAYELPPGEAVCPYHYEYAEEEWLLVLEGTPSVRGPGGTVELKAMDVVFFPRGPDGAHQVRNDSDAPARVVMFSPIVTPAATVYPDSDKVGIWTGNPDDNLMVPRSAGVDYYDGER